MPPFRHKRLDTSKRQIRLLQLLPTSSGVPHCWIRHFELDEFQRRDSHSSPRYSRYAPAYNALSYLWGPPTPEREILINGRSFPIRANLFDFLQSAHAIELAQAGKYIWIDQLCIDQSAMDERNHQVHMMADIYQRADEVLIWLGEADFYDQEAMHELAEADIATTFSSYFRGICEDIRCPFGNTSSAARERAQALLDLTHQAQPCEHTFSGFTTESSIVLEAVAAFLSSPYWTRLWIVQEIALARSRRILFGNRSLPWDSLAEICSQVIEHGLDKILGCEPHHAFALSGLTKGAYGSYQTELHTILWNFSDRGCAEPRDKVYGLQALLEPRRRLTVDYGIALPELFIDTAVQCVIMMLDAPIHERQRMDCWVDVSVRSSKPEWELECCSILGSIAHNMGLKVLMVSENELFLRSLVEEMQYWWENGPWVDRRFLVKWFKTCMVAKFLRYENPSTTYKHHKKRWKTEWSTLHNAAPPLENNRRI